MRKKTGDTWYGISEKNQLGLPTAALSASGIRNCESIISPFCLSKSPCTALLSIGVPQYASFLRLVPENLFFAKWQAIDSQFLRVEVDYFLSACRYKLPWIFILLFQCNTGDGVCQLSLRSKIRQHNLTLPLHHIRIHRHSAAEPACHFQDSLSPKYSVRSSIPVIPLQLSNPDIHCRQHYTVLLPYPAVPDTENHWACLQPPRSLCLPEYGAPCRPAHRPPCPP